MISPLIAPVRLTFNPTFTGIALLGSIGFILPEGVSTTQLFVVIFFNWNVYRSHVIDIT